MTIHEAIAFELRQREKSLARSLKWLRQCVDDADRFLSEGGVPSAATMGQHVADVISLMAEVDVLRRSLTWVPVTPRLHEGQRVRWRRRPEQVGTVLIAPRRFVCVQWDDPKFMGDRPADVHDDTVEPVPPPAAAEQRGSEQAAIEALTTEDTSEEAGQLKADGPTCGCGAPSRHESGWCGECEGNAVAADEHSESTVRTLTAQLAMEQARHADEVAVLRREIAAALEYAEERPESHRSGGQAKRLSAVVAAAKFAHDTLANDLGGWWLSAPPDDPLGQVRDRLRSALADLRVGDCDPPEDGEDSE